MRKWKTSRTPLSGYNCWNAMVQRCKKKGDPKYKRRKIKICLRWRHSFDNFAKDMGPRPSILHTIDRINTYGNYTPKNCRWATRKEQNYNRRDNIWITHKGKKMLQNDWAKELGVKQGTLASRLMRGWSIERALTK